MANKKSNKKTANQISTMELKQQSIDYLGVSKQPFANEILSEESFFKYQALDKISDTLIHQVQFSDLLLLVEGVHGAGKTSFYRQFIQIEIANTKTLAIQAEVTDTLTQIQQKMSIHLQDLGDANHLSDNLKSLQMFDQVPLAVINNSHVLSDTTLQELIRFQQQIKQEQDVSLKFLLFANTGMSDTLKKISDIQSDQMYVQNLPAFSPKQGNAFINHRLRCAGYFGETLLDDDAINQLFKTCNGSPLDIMIQAAPLIDKAVANILKPSSGLFKKLSMAVMILAVLSGAGYGAFNYFDTNSVDFSDTATQPKSTNELSEIANDEEQTDVIGILENDKILADNPVTLTENISQQNTEQNIHDDNALSEAEFVNLNDNSEIASDSSNKLTAEPEHQPEAQIKHVIEAAMQLPATSTSKLNPSLLELKAMGLRDAVWLLQQDPQNWTLQLLGAREPQTLLKFAKANNLAEDAAWYKTWLSSRPYYVMVYGNYISRDAARESISHLAPTLRALKPWVKSMKSVQKPLN